MWNKGAKIEGKEYPPGHNAPRDVRNDFYNDPNNITPMSGSDNSKKGAGPYRYADSPPGPTYRK